MNFARALLVFGLVSLPALRAVYAPIPEQDQGKQWTVTLKAGVTHDSNIFGAQTGAIASTIYEASPKIAFNASLDDQTFASASYQLTVDQFENRPGDKTLDSHDFSARLAHAFTSATTIDVSDQYQINKNPESLLSGVTLNTDQSFRRNGLDARFTTTLTEKTGVVVKFRRTDFSYDNAVLAQNIDRTENLYGLAGTYALVPEAKLVAEYRREDIGYRDGGATKDKQSDFAIGGFDYNLAKKMSASGRLGYTWRHRESERSTAAPYAEISAKYDYAERSYFTAGYSYTIEEISNIGTYTDTKVNRLFANLQHAVAATVVASGSVSYEPSQLQIRRPGTINVDETTTRVGLALTWLPDPHWSFALSYDHDRVESDDLSRGQERERIGASAVYSF
jgi:predicted porin